jgi:hypothetical protein
MRADVMGGCENLRLFCGPFGQWLPLAGGESCQAFFQPVVEL